MLPTVCIWGVTRLIHRKRAWVLSAGGLGRAFFCKYLPVSTLYCYKKVNYETRVPTMQVERDFGEIEE